MRFFVSKTERKKRQKPRGTFALNYAHMKPIKGHCYGFSFPSYICTITYAVLYSP